jgi:DNA sulfur modification protein DndD
MLRLRRLEVENFGPYKGIQALTFPESDGVVVIYGENRRGKTSLLNAIRFALLGQVVTRGSRPLPYHKVLNSEAREDGGARFRVALDFSFEGASYALTRSCEVRPGITDISNNDDFKTTVYLRRDGQALGKAETESALGRIMPAPIARFFLFDGELLSEYEELLRDQGESDVGLKIAAAIEQILGLPVLQHARDDIDVLTEEAEREESRAAQRDKQTAMIGTVMETLSALLQKQRSEHGRLVQQLAGATSVKADLEELLNKSVALGRLVAERDRVEREIREFEGEAAEKRAKLRVAMQTAWRGPLSRRLEPLRASLEGRRGALQTRITHHVAAAQRAKELFEGAESGKCPVCDHAVDPDMMTRLARETAASLSGTADTDQLELMRVHRDMDALTRLSAANDVVHITDLFDDVEAAKTKAYTRRARLKEVSEEIADFDEVEFKLQRKQFEQTLGEIRILQRGIESQSLAIQDTEGQLRDARKRLDKVSGPGLAAERRKREMFAGLADLFREGVAVYRNRLRERVERDATDLFLALTSEPDDAALRINEQYGLTILHNDGSEIVVRSSGAEQIVALSLMGALQKNAPLRGPIIADSLLMRVDDTHRENLVRALPTMAAQVAILVFRAELRPEAAHALLDGELLAEYQIRRVSAKHSTIEPFKGIL